MQFWVVIFLDVGRWNNNQGFVLMAQRETVAVLCFKARMGMKWGGIR